MESDLAKNENLKKWKYLVVITFELTKMSIENSKHCQTNKINKLINFPEQKRVYLVFCTNKFFSKSTIHFTVSPVVVHPLWLTSERISTDPLLFK